MESNESGLATARKIGDGLFFISWIVDTDSLLMDDSPRRQVELDKKEFFESCKMTYEVDEFNEMLSLELEIVMTQSLMPCTVKNDGVLAIYDGIQHVMKFKDSKWKTLWEEVQVIPDCYQCASKLYCGNLVEDLTYYQNHFTCPDTGENVPFTAKLVFQILVETEPASMMLLKNGKTSVLNHLSNLWESKTLADVTFKCKEKSIKAHISIIASGSPVLAAMFQHDFVENRERIVEISDIKPIVFESLLRYFYTGDVNLEIADVAQLLVAADKYGVDSLKDECSQFLSRNVALENSVQYLVLSHLHNSAELHEKTLDFLSRNAEAVCCRKDWMEVIKNYPELSFTAMQRMAKKCLCC